MKQTIRLLLPWVCLLLPAASEAQTGCNSVDFLSARQVPMYENQRVAGLVRETNGTYTAYYHNISPPYARVRSVPDFGARFAACQGLGQTSAAPMVPDTRPPGTGSSGYAVLPNAGNGPAVAAWIAFSGKNLQVFETNPDYSFKKRTDYPVGQRSGTNTADFNGDTKPDMAVVVEDDPNYAGYLAVLLGNGDGTYQQAIRTATGLRFPSAFATGDFNRDGKMDAVVTHGDGVVILLGNGDGTMRAQAPFPNLQYFQALAVADVTADGRLDIILGGEPDAVVLAGNGDGTFRTPLRSPTSPNPLYIAVGDFNRDSRPDLAIGSMADAVFIQLGNGDGTFRAPAGYVAVRAPRSLVLTDFNHDGNLDVVVGEGSPEVLGPLSDTGYMTVLFGKGDGTLHGAPLLTPGASPAAIAAADFNGDGKTDFAAASTSSYSIILAAATGGYQAAVKSSDANGGALLAADFNKDGRPDLAFAGQALFVAQGLGNGTFQKPVPYNLPEWGKGIAAADFNGDGRLDIAVTYNGSSSQRPYGLQVYLQQAGGAFHAFGAEIRTGSVPNEILAGDWNGDGKTDLAVVNYGTFDSATDPGGLSILLGQGNGSFAAPVSYPAGLNPTSVSAGDLNRDGKTDLVVTTSAPNYGNRVGVLLGDGNGTFRAINLISVDFGPSDALIHDFDGDGAQDLLVAHCCGDTDLTYMLGLGDGTFGPEVHTGNPSPSALLGGDFDGDGRKDVAVVPGSSVQNGGFSVLLNRSPGQQPFVNVSGASFARGPMAPESIISAFGANLAGGTELAATTPLPLTLAGTTVKVKDSAGVERSAPLFAATPLQLNYLVPQGTALGRALVTVTRGDGVVQTTEADIAPVSPGLFKADADGLAASQLTRVNERGEQSIEDLVTRDGTGKIVPVPIDFVSTQHRLFLLLYGTGIRGRSALSDVQVTIGDFSVRPDYAGAHSAYVGLDQVNVALPRGLIGKGLVDVKLTVEGRVTNTVKVQFK